MKDIYSLYHKTYETSLNGYYRMLQKSFADFYDILNRYLTCVMNADKILEIVMTNEKD